MDLSANSISNLVATLIIKYDKAQLSSFISNLDSYRILFFILCKRKLSDPIIDEDIEAILIELLKSTNPFSKFPLARLTDDTIYYSLYEFDLIDLLLDPLNEIGYSSIVKAYKLYKMGNEESLELILGSHYILYAAITDSYDKEICQLYSSDLFNITYFLFCLLKAYVLKDYSFYFESYNDTKIILKLLSLSVKRNEIFSKIQSKKNYNILFKDFNSIKLSNSEGQSLYIIKNICKSLIDIYNGILKSLNHGNNLTQDQEQKYTLILYLMGIDLLKELMETQRETQRETQIDIEADNMDMDMDHDPEIKQQIEDFIKLTCSKYQGQYQGVAGGRRRRIIRRLKSYK